jgi:hypothetical protein
LLEEAYNLDATRRSALDPEGLLQKQQASQAILADDELALVEEVEVETVVIEALKSETTVDEAPAIVTVMTDKEIAEMGHRTVAAATQDIPGFLYNEAFYHTGRGALVRGMLMSALVLHNTVDLYMSGSGALPYGGNVLAGTKLWQDRIKIFALFNYHTWRHPEMWFPNKVLLRSTIPQPISHIAVSLRR